MNYRQKFVLTVVLLLCISALSCKSGSLIPISDGGQELPRYVAVQGQDLNPKPAPYELRAGVYIVHGPKDFDKNPFWTRIDINYGDGSGWIDYTESMLDYFSGAIKFEDLPAHHYGIPGDYALQARVVYWDGEVVYSGPNAAVLTVLPPEGGGGSG